MSVEFATPVVSLRELASPGSRAGNKSCKASRGPVGKPPVAKDIQTEECATDAGGEASKKTGGEATKKTCGAVCR
jgi:hypothetical protein